MNADALMEAKSRLNAVTQRLINGDMSVAREAEGALADVIRLQRETVESMEGANDGEL